MTALAERHQPIQLQLVTFDREQIDLIKTQIAPDASDGELALFVQQCKRTGLDPFSRQIYAVVREQSQKDERGNWIKVKKTTIHTAIDGFRLIAERTGKYRGQVGPWWCGKDGVWKDVWPSDEPPAAARVGVLRSDFAEPLYAVARDASFAQKNRDGKPISQWATMPDIMLAKTAQVQALRRAFPNDLSGLYATEEMMQADEPNADASTPSREDRRATNVAPEPSQDEAALQAWAKKLTQVRGRLRDLNLDEQAVAVLGKHKWRANVDAAWACYDELDALGKAAQPKQEAPTDVPSVQLITAKQLGALHGHFKRVGLTTSEDRYAFAAYMLNLPAAKGTNELLEDEARSLLDMLADLDTDALTRTIAEWRHATREQPSHA